MVLYDRPTRHKTTERLTLKLHHTKLFESTKIKYLGLILDNKLNWKFHIAELSKKLSRGIGLLYKIRNMCPISVLQSLYHSLFNSHLSYGLVVWGNAKRTYIDKIKALQKRALRSMVFIRNDDEIDINRIHFHLKILKLDDQLQLQMASLMWDYDHNTLPQSLRANFKRANLIHNYSTRAASKGSLYHPKVKNNNIGIKSFKYQGVNLLNNLKNTSIYGKASSKRNFLKNLKSDLLSSYIIQ